jgi:hypothetical protein
MRRSIWRLFRSGGERVMDIDESKQQTRNAFANRALLYYYLFDEMRREMGEERAKEVFVRAVRRRGAEIGAKYADAAQAGDFAAVAGRFVDDSPCEGELFEPAVLEIADDSCTLTMSTCPLVEAWRDAGLDDDEVALMCRLAAEIDFATFESVGLSLQMNEKIGEGARACKLVLRRG